MYLRSNPSQAFLSLLKKEVATLPLPDKLEETCHPLVSHSRSSFHLLEVLLVPIFQANCKKNIIY